MAPFKGHSPILTIALAINLFMHCTVASWWQLGLTTPPAGLEMQSASHRENCLKLDFLNQKQKELCTLSEKLLSAISIGARLGIEECQHQFRHSRWNCSLSIQQMHQQQQQHQPQAQAQQQIGTSLQPTTSYNNSTTIFGKVLTIGSREAAYIYAVSAASVAFAVTRACTRGDLNVCACDNKVRSKPRKWQWGGCSEDIHYGEKFSRFFVDAGENSYSATGMMNIHNNEAGRRAIRSRMVRVCKCHGMSGSCSMRVCWRRLPAMRVVGEALGARFEGASHVKLVDRRHGKKLKPLSKELKKPNKTDLVYVEDSPDYCERNETLSILGTKGRICNQTSHGLDGCRLLCCGRGYQTRIRQVQEKCKCRFVWCCSVQCEVCKNTIEEHVCN